MIPFDIDKLEVRHVQVKGVTTALGGSISVLDTDRSTENKEVFKKIKVPMAVARAFIKLHEVSRYLKPVWTAVMVYDEHVVALERHPLGSMGTDTFEGLFGEQHWTSDSERALDKVIMPLTLKGDWYTDGTFIYTFQQIDLAEAEFLSHDGRFRSVRALALKFATAHQNITTPDLQDRTCLQYVSPTGATAMTSPIWKKLGQIGSSQMSKADPDDDDFEDVASAFQFDKIDQYLSVNLGFALKAGKEISALFGFDSIEPLQLDDLMIQFRTVNLPTIPKAVKQTADVGLPFTHAVAWLIGMTIRTETLDAYIILRSLLKYLTTKGVYRKGAFEPSSVYHAGMGMDNVPFKTIDEAADTAAVSMENATMIGDLYRARRTTTEGVGAIGELYGAE